MPAVAAVQAASLHGAEPVQVIGNKVVLYRRSERKNFEHIL